MTLDEKLARLRAHRSNIHRYRRLLSTRLSDIEREFLSRRLSEEQSAIDALSATAFPFGSHLRDPISAAASRGA
ncbi:MULTISPECIES: hypothetical protein [Bradyrhizobium]|uniref:Uncharacterized protein n=1 Tax=Bradyrhizobium barranii subsp. barranii TaxID=2823807 RepID=A0A7Z0QFB0_9BRAD|nr:MULTISPECIES: hypothetical protein [Bradyrhizobium]MCD9108151.1 hypothetical protein [Bradyrhizobium japonicum]MCD9258641.1 hypothetical protein [Bradyrhizobium japonicum SEMIA 5079]MCD9821959.1 hypothetical protein [Bradyrhizobium japonicum]MCD9893977.1 hypothetical protein [Bradyrhizobium japonicum]MCD9906480.1 hypothetical protein [Bradyrhizobium japonicum]